MRTIKTTGFPQDTDLTKFPDGQINNETDTQIGTPVVREIYGDVLTNLYALMRDSGITANGNEDSELTQYQLLEAFKKFTNELNDIRQVAAISGTDISVNFDLDFLPDNYVFIGLVSDDITAGQNYNITGTGNNSYVVKSSENIDGSSVVLFVINQSIGEIVPLSGNGNKTLLIANLSNPISFNETENLYYFSNGKILTNTPNSFDVQQIIRVSQSNNDLSVVDAIIHKQKLICFVINTVSLEYSIATFSINDLTVVEFFETPLGISGVDNQPYLYADKDFLYFTNSDAQLNSILDDFSIAKYDFNNTTGVMTFVSANSIENNFSKTTNAVIKSDELFTLVNGELNKYDLNSNTISNVKNLDIVNGIIFNQGEKIYYTNGSVATEWNI